MPYGAGKVASGTFGTMAFQDADAVDITGGHISGLSFLEVGIPSSLTGELRLANGTNTNVVTIEAGVSAASRTYVWPLDFGAAGTVLTDAGGNGVLSWVAGAASPSAGFVLNENAFIGLDTVLSADGKYTGIAINGTLGENVAFGEMVYLKQADSKWYRTDADADTTAGAVAVACCVLAGGNTDPTVLLLSGNVRADAVFPALTIGAPVYLSTTTGAIQVAQPSGTDDIIRIVGYALTADSILFQPSNDYLTHT